MLTEKKILKNLRKYLVIRNKTIIFVLRNKIKQYGFTGEY